MFGTFFGITGQSLAGNMAAGPYSESITPSAKDVIHGIFNANGDEITLLSAESENALVIVRALTFGESEDTNLIQVSISGNLASILSNPGEWCAVRVSAYTGAVTVVSPAPTTGEYWVIHS